jgi:hypothetical protein
LFVPVIFVVLLVSIFRSVWIELWTTATSRSWTGLKSWFVSSCVYLRERNHTGYNAARSGEMRVPPLPTVKSVQSATHHPSRQIIARRAAMELKMHDIVNLGIGMPEGVVRCRKEVCNPKSRSIVFGSRDPEPPI